MSTAQFAEVLFIGFFTAAALYSALVFLMTADRPFLWYAALMGTTAAAQLAISPHIVPLMTGRTPLHIYGMVSLGAFFVAEVTFVRAFLGLAQRAPGFMRLLYALLGLSVLGMVLQYVSKAEYIHVADHALFLALLAVCGAAAWRGASKSAEARLFVLAFGGALAGAIASNFAEWFALRHWPEYFFQFGVAWQGIVLALALTQRYTKIQPVPPAREDKRLPFEERLSTAWGTATANQSGLAVIAIAVGGLKEYNANHGRAAGEALLRNVASLCAKHCSERVDWYAIWDEAFAAIVPNVTRVQADVIAFHLRERVARECPLVIGVGVASIQNAISSEALVQQAARRSARDTIRRELPFEALQRGEVPAH